MSESSSKDTAQGTHRSSEHSTLSLAHRPLRGKASYGGDKKGASNTEELKAILFGTLMISRLKKNILTQLPPKRRHVVAVTVTDETLARRLR
jgi:hypothetical protein